MVLSYVLLQTQKVYNSLATWAGLKIWHFRCI